ncbi:hypothetical protein PV325_011157, partial [Microctonus aethiopoides]
YCESNDESSAVETLPDEDSEKHSNFEADVRMRRYSDPDFEKTINSSADNVVKKFENFHISTDHRVEKEFNDDSTLSSNATDVKSIRNLIQDKSNSEETLKTRCQNILENHERKSESIKNIIKIKKKRIDLRDVRDEDDDIALLSVSSFGSILISVKANLNSRQHGFACLEDK